MDTLHSVVPEPVSDSLDLVDSSKLSQEPTNPKAYPTIADILDILDLYAIREPSLGFSLSITTTSYELAGNLLRSSSRQETIINLLRQYIPNIDPETYIYDNNPYTKVLTATQWGNSKP